MRSLTLSLGFAAVLAAGLGCSSDNPYSSSHFAVSGKLVSPTGEPLRGAQVRLLPKGKDGKSIGKEATGVVAKDGTFTMKSAGARDGVAGGYYAVVVNPVDDKKHPDWQYAYSRIPKHYYDEETSDLFIEVTADKKDWEVKLNKTKPATP